MIAPVARNPERDTHDCPMSCKAGLTALVHLARGFASTPCWLQECGTMNGISSTGATAKGTRGGNKTL